MASGATPLRHENSTLILWWNNHHQVIDQVRNGINSRAITRIPAKYFYSLYYLVFLLPLEKLYLHGPTLHGWGFWGGRSWDNICSELTQVDASFWHANQQECADLIERHFYQFVVLVQVCVYFFLLARALQYAWNVAWCCRGCSRSGRRRQEIKQEYRRFSDSLDSLDFGECRDHISPIKRGTRKDRDRAGRKRLSVSA